MYSPRLVVGDFIRGGRGLVQSLTKPKLPPLLTTALFLERRHGVFREDPVLGDGLLPIKIRLYYEMQGRRADRGVDLYDLVQVGYATHRLPIRVQGHFRKVEELIETRLTLEEVKSVLTNWENRKFGDGTEIARSPNWTPLHYSKWVKEKQPSSARPAAFPA